MEQPIVAYLEAEGAGLVVRFNDDFGDAVLLVARALGGFPAATAAAIVAIDPEGIDAVVTDPDGEHPARIDFGVEVTVPDHLTLGLIDLLERARAASGEDGETAAEREAAALDADPHLPHRGRRRRRPPPPPAPGHLPGRRPDRRSRPAGPDTFLFLLLPPPGRTELGIDQTFTWEAHARMAVEDQPVGGYYTVRRWRPEVAELDVWMVLHGDGGHRSSAWAARAQPGDRVALWGPRTAYHPPEGTDRLAARRRRDRAARRSP